MPPPPIPTAAIAKAKAKRASLTSASASSNPGGGPVTPPLPPPSSDPTGGCASGTTQQGSAPGCEGCPSKEQCKSSAPDARTVGKNRADLESSTSQIKHKVLVLSGKGGVGKSTVSASLAFQLSSLGYSVGVLDVDICGPSLPLMLGCVGRQVHHSNSGWSPVYVRPNLAVMSTAFLLPGEDDAVVWRGPRKNGLIRQFLTDTDWGDLDFLIVDTPPGTSDEHISTVQHLRAGGAE
eukprot:CAMPEP_0182464194 /NCGR_PEP_ID=MMETSP1319-20130603/8377_1 /TAXON_ID=172717 /ORGANISM="Bolidomonas pacifica, Strain RCC208" /LENGTH=235 /DNA_ID=CAMNT_0024663821 /DNA_START=32 /DNA_END=736 /DNA_ORIENTATION=-